MACAPASERRINQMIDLPMSARLPKTEQRYQDDKAAGRTVDLLDVPPIFKGNHKHFKIVENHYPYDAIFETHHMLVCKRRGGKPQNFTVEEKREFQAIMFSETYKYSCVIENFKARSVMDIWHIHLATYYTGRPEWLQQGAHA